MIHEARKREIGYLSMMGVPPEKQGKLYRFQADIMMHDYLEHLKIVSGAGMRNKIA